MRSKLDAVFKRCRPSLRVRGMSQGEAELGLLRPTIAMLESCFSRSSTRRNPYRVRSPPELQRCFPYRQRAEAFLSLKASQRD